MMTVTEQIEIFAENEGLPTTMNGSIAMCAMFMEPKSALSKTIIDSKNRKWTHCEGTTYYKCASGHTCPLMYIENWHSN